MKRLTAVTTGLAILILSIGFAAVSKQTVQANPDTRDRLAQIDTSFEGLNIYFSEDNGEASRVERGGGGISRLAGLLRGSGATLNTLDWRLPLPVDMDLLILAGPTGEYGGDQIARIWAYLNNGGRVLMLVNPPLPQGRGRGAFASGNALFILTNADYALQPLDDVVVIETTRQQNGQEVPTIRATFVTENLNPNHPITQSISGGFLFFQGRSFVIDTPSEGTITPLIYAPDDSYGETAFAQFQTDGTFNFDIGADTAPGQLAMAASYENEITGARFVLIGDREFAMNGWGFNASPPNSAGFLNPANVNFMLNSIAWLTETSWVPLTFPTPGPTGTPTITPSPLPPTPTPDPNATATPTAGS